MRQKTSDSWTWLTAGAIYIVLSVVWCSKFFSFTDLGSHCMTEGDPALNAWALSWVARAFRHAPSSVFDGNTFYPHPGSILLSEHMASLAIFAVPVRFVTTNPWVPYNLLVFGAYLLSAVGGWRFLHWLTGSRGAAFWGGLYWPFFYFRVHHIGHLQILSCEWFPFVALYVLKVCRAPTARNALLFALFFVLQALVSWYLAVIVGVLAVVLGVSGLVGAPVTRRHLAAFAGAGTLIAFAVLPFAWPYRDALQSTTLAGRLTNARSLGDQVSLADFLTPPDATVLGGLVPDNPYWIWGENTLYVGYVPLALALAGLVGTLWTLRTGGRLGSKSSREVLAAALLIVGGYVLCLGYVSPRWGIRLPLHYLAQAIPPVAAMQATQRYALLLNFGVLILSGVAMAALLQTLRAPWMRGLALVALTSGFLLEVYPLRVPLDPHRKYAPSAPDEAIAALQRASGKGRPLVVLHYPIYQAMPGYPVLEATYMLDSTLHWANVVNGFSGAVPVGFHSAMQTLARMPSPEALELATTYKIDVLAVHAALPAAQQAAIRSYFEAEGTGRVQPLGDREFIVLLKDP